MFAQKQGSTIELFCSFKEKASSLLDDIIEDNLSIYRETTRKESSLNLKNEYEQLVLFKEKAKQVAHEVKNPITSVKGFIQLLKPHLVEIGKVEYAEVALRELERTYHIVYDFLNQSSCNTYIKKKTPSSKLIEEMVTLSKAEATLYKIDISYQASDIEPYLYVNADQIKQVLLNIIKNALEAIRDCPMSQKGKINISTKLNQECFIITIRDNGPGMNEDTLANLFYPNYTTKNYGSGIGLSVCNKIIKDHHGSITVSSNLGNGTTFQVHLPLEN